MTAAQERAVDTLKGIKEKAKNIIAECDKYSEANSLSASIFEDIKEEIEDHMCMIREENGEDMIEELNSILDDLVAEEEESDEDEEIDDGE